LIEILLFYLLCKQIICKEWFFKN